MPARPKSCLCSHKIDVPVWNRACHEEAPNIWWVTNISLIWQCCLCTLSSVTHMDPSHLRQLNDQITGELLCKIKAAIQQCHWLLFSIFHWGWSVALQWSQNCLWHPCLEMFWKLEMKGYKPLHLSDRSSWDIITKVLLIPQPDWNSFIFGLKWHLRWKNM